MTELQCKRCGTSDVRLRRGKIGGMGSSGVWVDYITCFNYDCENYEKETAK